TTTSSGQLKASQLLLSVAVLLPPPRYNIYTTSNEIIICLIAPGLKKTTLEIFVYDAKKIIIKYTNYRIEGGEKVKEDFVLPLGEEMAFAIEIPENIDPFENAEVEIRGGIVKIKVAKATNPLKKMKFNYV
ncbi:12308_t:CDS:2, partial [Ambispora gerdemannii]